MHNLRICKHARKRMQQRSIRKSDIRLIVEYGEDIAGDGVFLSGKGVIVKSGV